MRRRVILGTHVELVEADFHFCSVHTVVGISFLGLVTNPQLQIEHHQLSIISTRHRTVAQPHLPSVRPHSERIATPRGCCVANEIAPPSRLSTVQPPRDVENTASWLHRCQPQCVPYTHTSFVAGTAQQHASRQQQQQAVDYVNNSNYQAPRELQRKPLLGVARINTAAAHRGDVQSWLWCRCCVLLETPELRFGLCVCVLLLHRVLLRDASVFGTAVLGSVLSPAALVLLVLDDRSSSSHGHRSSSRGVVAVLSVYFMGEITRPAFLGYALCSSALVLVVLDSVVYEKNDTNIACTRMQRPQRVPVRCDLYKRTCTM